MAIVDLMQVTNPIMNALRWVVCSGWAGVVFVFRDMRYSAAVKKISVHVSLL